MKVFFNTLLSEKGTVFVVHSMSFFFTLYPEPCTP